MNNYDDIINLEHHVSSKREKMSVENRAAQFAPFAALTGYEEEIEEKGRTTESFIELDLERQNILSKKLEILEQNIKLKPEITITYFVKDLKKDGGKYVTDNFNLRRIDKVKRELIMTDKTVIKFRNILDINLPKEV